MRFIFAIVALMSAKAFAFPDMVRHGYVHCTACHTSLVGGNLLNEYGRALSSEALSQKSLGGKAVGEGEEEFLYGFVKPTKKLLLGGDVRTLQLFVESEQASRGRFFIMQVDVDAFYEISSRVRAFFSVGRVEPQGVDTVAKDYIASPRHGIEVLLSNPESETRSALRVGRFMPAFGIAFPEHMFVTRRLLDFSPGQERYAAEVSWNDAKTSAIGTALFSQAQGNQTKPEQGGTLQLARGVGEASKVGLSYYQGQIEQLNSRFTRRAHGLFAHLSFTEKWYALLEVDRIKDAQGTWGLIDTFKLGYEAFQGLHFFGVHEFANMDMADANPKYEAYSLGTQWFPRPHWDFLAMYRQERNTAVRDSFDNVFWFVAHFYL